MVSRMPFLKRRGQHRSVVGGWKLLDWIVNRIKITMWLLASMAVFLGAGCAGLGNEPREEATYSAGDVGRRIVDFVQSSEATRFSGAVLAAKDGRVVAAVGVGHADLAGKLRNTPGTLFEIASATKQFTAAAVLRLVQEKRLGLDDSIAKHLPGVPENCRAITVRHLLQHTSGIPGTNSRGGGADLGRVLPLFLRGGPKHPPGTHWEYWNQGYSLLSEIVARVAGEEYTAFCRGKLFTTAGMRATRFTGDAAPARAVVAIGRSARGKPRSALAHPYGSYGFQYRGMGGAVTTVWDLWRWDRALRGDEVLGQSAKAELFKPGLRDYALGWFVKKNARGQWVQSHGGSVRGFVCQIRRYPKDNACLFVLCNRDNLPVRKMADALEKILFGKSAPAPVTAP
jgi:CubicO group peptidase (beta-lactamase class C family)